MKNKERIEIGDVVDVDFVYTGSEFGLTITGCPGDVGDSWKTVRRDGTVVYFQLYARMVKRTN